MDFTRYKWVINIWWLVTAASAVYLGRHPGQRGCQVTQLGIINVQRQNRAFDVLTRGKKITLPQQILAYKGINKNWNVGLHRKAVANAGVKAYTGHEFPVGCPSSRWMCVKVRTEDWSNLGVGSTLSPVLGVRGWDQVWQTSKAERSRMEPEINKLF